jgi:hypothetical protein
MSVVMAALAFVGSDCASANEELTNRAKTLIGILYKNGARLPKGLITFHEDTPENTKFVKSIGGKIE